MVQTVRAPLPPPSRRTSLLPAMSILGLAVVMLVVFGFMNMIGSPTATPTTLPTIVGGLKADPATTVFSGWAAGGEPPANVASGLVAPVGARWIASVDTGGSGPSSSDYDLEARLSVDASRAALLGFYRAELEGRGWKLFSRSGTAGGSAVLLFQKAGTDGFYWEAGVVASAGPHGSTHYEFRLQQVSDYS